jgi:hypothetical protein
MLKAMSETYPDIKSKLFGAIKRAPLKGWETIQNAELIP